MDGTVLVADDDRTIRTVLTQALTRAGCRVHATSSLVTLLRWVEEGMGDLVISDVMMPDGNGIEALPRIAAARPGLPVIVISARNTIRTAIEAAEAEAWDYLPKPFDLPDLMKRAARAMENRRQPTTPRPAAPQGAAPDLIRHDLPLVGSSPAMQALYRLVARIMNSDLPVLVTGESGTGKSLIVRAIHDYSDRRAQPFVCIASAELAAPDGPAIALARAKSGSILFEEVRDLDAEAQARAVRMLDSLGEDAPRVLATSQVDLVERMEAGDFRADLYFRLGGITLKVPPLRERVEDIALLCEHFIARWGSAGPRHFTPGAMDLIRAHVWPGNVRELENTVRRLAVTGGEESIGPEEVAMVLGTPAKAGPQMVQGDGERLSESIHRHLRRHFDLHGGQLPPPGLYQRVLREVELPLIGLALDATAGNQARCADLLGINRNTLRKKLSDLDIRVTRGRKLM